MYYRLLKSIRKRNIKKENFSWRIYTYGFVTKISLTLFKNVFHELLIYSRKTGCVELYHSNNVQLFQFWFQTVSNRNLWIWVFWKSPYKNWLIYEQKQNQQKTLWVWMSGRVNPPLQKTWSSVYPIDSWFSLNPEL